MALPFAAASPPPPVVRAILNPARAAPTAATDLDTAFIVTDAFPDGFLRDLEALRARIPLDASRPTCPRRFLQEWLPPGVASEKVIAGSSKPRHYEDGWATAGIDRGLAVWAEQVASAARFVENAHESAAAEGDDRTLNAGDDNNHGAETARRRLQR